MSAYSRGQEAEAAPKKLLVELHVFEVNVSKVKHLGFDWSHIARDGVKRNSIDEFVQSLNEAGQVDQLPGFLTSLQQNGLARAVARPTLATLDGRPASLEVGSTKLDVVPIVLGSGQVRLECKIEVAAPTNERGSPFRFDSAAELELGKTSVVGRCRNSSPAANGKTQETETLVLARVDLLKSTSQR